MAHNVSALLRSLLLLFGLSGAICGRVFSLYAKHFEFEYSRLRRLKWNLLYVDGYIFSSRGTWKLWFLKVWCKSQWNPYFISSFSALQQMQSLSVSLIFRIMTLQIQIPHITFCTIRQNWKKVGYLIIDLIYFELC